MEFYRIFRRECNYFPSERFKEIAVFSKKAKMRRHILKATLLILFCALFFTISVSGQVEPAPLPLTGVEDVYLAKDDGNGKAGDVVSTFSPTDIPIHCIVQLDSLKVATVKMNLVAVKVAGVKPETKIVTVSYTTSGNQNQVNFTGKPDKLWTPGTYRVDVFFDGKLAKSHDFQIEKAGGKNAPAPAVKAVNAFQPAVAPKPKPQQRKLRRN